MDQKKLRVFFYLLIHLHQITNILILEEFRRLVIPMQKKNSWRKSNLVIEICAVHTYILYRQLKQWLFRFLWLSWWSDLDNDIDLVLGVAWLGLFVEVCWSSFPRNPGLICCPACYSPHLANNPKVYCGNSVRAGISNGWSVLYWWQPSSQTFMYFSFNNISLRTEIYCQYKSNLLTLVLSPKVFIG